jgi:alkylated DNA repair dioxygenase AlkB
MTFRWRSSMKKSKVVSSTIPTMENLLPFQGEVYFFPQFFSETSSKQYFQTLLKTIRWNQEPIKIFGKEVMQPRLTAWHGESTAKYSYSGISLIPNPWTQTLKEIKDKIETVAEAKFTGALLNLYRDGKDSMGWHRDNEKELGVNPVIGSISFGATRTFQFRNYEKKDLIKSIELTDGSFLLMKGETQHYWQHRITKSTRIIAPRINITFRVI